MINISSHQIFKYLNQLNYKANQTKINRSQKMQKITNSQFLNSLTNL